MKKVKGLLILWVAAGLISCDSKQPENESIEVEMEQVTDQQSPIALNENNEKWAVNEEMKPFVNEGVRLVNDFLESNDEDFETLIQKLNEQNSQLIESCTMTGRSHDELHKWLHPHLEVVKKIGEAQNPNEAKEVVEAVKLSYQVYDEYFQ